MSTRLLSRPLPLLAALACSIVTPVVHAAAQPHWVASWTASSQPTTKAPNLGGRTVRQRLHLALAGKRVRVRLSNRYGKTPLHIGAATLATAGEGGAIVDKSLRALRFAGASSVVIPAGEERASDAVTLAAAAPELELSLFTPDADTQTTTVHALAVATTWDAAGDQTTAHVLRDPRALESWFYVSGIDVDAPAAVRAVVAIGDSITDGMGSTKDANRRWPNRLQARLDGKRAPLAVVNAGIAGNGLLRPIIGDPLLARFEHDALEQPGVAYVMLLIGINDIAQPYAPNEPHLTAAQFIAAYQQLAGKAHARGVKLIGATLMAISPEGPADEPLESLRQAVNQWLRTTHDLDGCVDFDKATRDPQAPTKLRRDFDSGDQLHPNDAGYAAMADAVDLALLGVR